MRAKLKLNGKEIEIPDIEKADGIKKYTGLMFKSTNTNALLFDFKNSKQAIHSLFCPDFLAIWLNEGKIVDYKLITTSKFTIKPEKEFTHLLEIPVNDKYAEVISNFLETKLQSS